MTTDPNFEKDHELTGRHSLWDLMNQVEKEQLLENVRSMLQSEFESKEMELVQQHRAELSTLRAESLHRLESWSKGISAQQARERQKTAVEAAGLALALAGKVIREAARTDPDFLTRTLETALFKVQESCPLTAILNPTDADLLQKDPELMARLRIEAVIPDRRVEQGGCLIRAGVREWDATISSQLDALAEIVEETLAEGQPLAQNGPGDNYDPGLD